MAGQLKRTRFEQTVLPHWTAAYNLARWLTGFDQDADDVVQEAYLRAFKFFDGFHGDDSRAWLLTIVRNTAYTWLRQHRAQALNTVFDEELQNVPSGELTSEERLLQIADHLALRECLEALPVPFREVIILHEMEGLSYKEIALIADIPIGTVMSRLARARKHLQQCVMDRVGKE